MILADQDQSFEERKWDREQQTMRVIGHQLLERFAGEQ
jgi:hypothetical protein